MLNSGIRGDAEGDYQHADDEAKNWILKTEFEFGEHIASNTAGEQRDDRDDHDHEQAVAKEDWHAADG